MDELKLSFLEEAEELFDEAEEILINAEDSGDISNEEVNSLFRAIHTLKGGSGSVGFEKFVEITHIFENFLDKIRNNEITPTKEIISFLLDSLDKLKTILNEEAENTLDEDEFKNVFNELQNEINKFSSDNKSQQKQKEKNKDEGFELFIETEEKEDEGFELFIETEEDEKIEKKENEKVEDEKIKTQEDKNKVEKKEDKKQTKKKEVKPKETKSDKISSIRVNLEKIDDLMNKVADLVITKSMIYQIAIYLKNNALFEKLEILDRNVRDLQQAVMSIRMVPMEQIYAKIPKIVRDIAKKLNKKVKVETYGGNVEIDKLMIEALIDPLTHILRNAIDHGIESEEERIKKGKPSQGTIKISSTQESGQIIITIEDDGRGINVEKVVNKAIEKGILTKEEANKLSYEEKLMLIFSPGLSTAEKISDISGRGVGMDVVMNNIREIGGNIKVESTPDKGTKFIIILPLTLAILDGLDIRIGKIHFIYPVNMILEAFQPSKEMIQTITPNEEILMLRGEFIPIIRLHKFFDIECDSEDLTKGIVIISKVGESKYALFIDEFLMQSQVVVKSLEKNFKKVLGISATTIKGDGSIGLILDIINITKEYKKVINGDYNF